MPHPAADAEIWRSQGSDVICVVQIILREMDKPAPYELSKLIGTKLGR